MRQLQSYIEFRLPYVDAVQILAAASILREWLFGSAAIRFTIELASKSGLVPHKPTLYFFAPSRALSSSSFSFTRTPCPNLFCTSSADRPFFATRFRASVQPSSHEEGGGAARAPAGASTSFVGTINPHLNQLVQCAQVSSKASRNPSLLLSVSQNCPFPGIVNLVGFCVAKGWQYLRDIVDL